MNAIIALCHFCETHGPCPVFCTQTLRDTKIDELIFNFDVINKNCVACDSIGNSIGLLSEDSESNAHFISTQIPVITECVPLVKQAAFRSLSCEVSPNGGIMFFGDSTRSHTLCHTFQLRDSQARGLFRLFSIIIMMKDKMFLLNIQPFLANNLLKLSKELEMKSLATYAAEESKCSVRANRLNTGQASSKAPRSLAELTGEENVFARLHSHFTWILWAGARYLTETVTLGGVLAIPPQWSSAMDKHNNSNTKINKNNKISKNKKDSFVVVQMDRDDWLSTAYFDSNGFDDVDDTEITYSFRKCRELLKSQFIAVCYCTIIGIQIVIRGKSKKSYAIVKCLKKLIPEALHKLTRCDSRRYVPTSECRILSVTEDAAVPQPCSNIFRIDLNGDYVTTKWTGDVPSKWPDLLQKIIKAIDEKLFNDYVLDRHMRVLIEEWKNKILCMKKVTSNHDLNKLKKILGIQQQDQLLINYWSNWL